MSTAQTVQCVVNRRRYERFATLPMYTAVAVDDPATPGSVLEGHAYDISEGGIRFELDRAIDPGTQVTMRIALPAWLAGGGRGAEPAAVEVKANVVWIDDDGVPGPVRMAAAFTSFADASDRGRLLGALATGSLRRAA